LDEHVGVSLAELGRESEDGGDPVDDLVPSRGRQVARFSQ
jgi:hypothetical protein